MKNGKVANEGTWRKEGRIGEMQEGLLNEEWGNYGREKRKDEDEEWGKDGTGNREGTRERSKERRAKIDRKIES